MPTPPPTAVPTPDELRRGTLVEVDRSDRGVDVAVSAVTRDQVRIGDPALPANLYLRRECPGAGRMALLGQSGGIGLFAIHEMLEAGVGLQVCMSVNANPSPSGRLLVEHWAADPGIEAICLHLETFAKLGDLTEFVALAATITPDTPIVALKSGRTSAGRRAAASHTGAAATDDALVDALFRRAGIVRVDTFSELLDLGVVLADRAVPAGRRVGIVCNAGGHGVLAADACEVRGLEVPELGAATRERLGTFLTAGRPTHLQTTAKPTGVSNPVDLDATSFGPEYRQCARWVADDDAVDATIVIFTPPPGFDAAAMAPDLAAGLAGAGPPTMACLMGVHEPLDAFRNPPGGGRRIPNVPTTERAAAALAGAVRYREWCEQAAADPGGPPPAVGDAVALVEGFLAARPAGGWLAAPDAYALAAAAGLTTVPTRIATDLDGVLAAAAAFGGPVAIKGGHADLVHKTEAGAVALGLVGPDAVAVAYRRMHDALGDRLGPVVVQPMAAPGVETIVGGLRDETFGPVVLVGLGGVLTDLWDDRAFALAPAGRAELHRLVGGLRGSALLTGYRGSEPVDLEALATVVERVAALLAACPAIAELDLNPVVARPDGVIALDVAVRLTPR